MNVINLTESEFLSHVADYRAPMQRGTTSATNLPSLTSMPAGVVPAVC